jgi:hypothetical protein
MKTNLNKLFKNRSHSKEAHNEVTVSFDENVEYICSKIENSEVVIGCAPWFSNKKIFNSLIKVSEGISIVLDKSTVNKSIKSNSTTWVDHDIKPKKSTLYEFNALPFNLSLLPTDFEYTPFEDNVINKCSFRVVGRDQSTQKNKTLFHYKFLIICEVNKSDDMIIKIIPKSVICGSFNFSNNAEQSREALLHIENTDVAQEFYDEWARAYMLSENIEKFSKDLNPEYLPAKTEEEVLGLLAQDDSIKRMADAHEYMYENDAAMIDKAASPYR